MSEFIPQPIKLQGKDYLEVAPRVLWLRTEHPDAQIVTDVIENDRAEGYALIKAIISIPSTGGSATGYGSASRKDLRGPVAAAYLEKAETRAIGRAAAGLGYGTLAALEEGPDTLADAPVTRGQVQTPIRDAFGGHYTAAMITDYMARTLGVTGDDTKSFIEALTEGRYRKLSEMDEVALQRFGSSLNRWRNREDVEWFRQHGTHPLDDPPQAQSTSQSNRSGVQPASAPAGRPQAVRVDTGATSSIRPAPAPAQDSAATQKPSTDPALAAAWKEFAYIAPLAGYETERAQIEYLRGKYPNCTRKSLTAAELWAQSTLLRAGLGMAPHPASGAVDLEAVAS